MTMQLGIVIYSNDPETVWNAFRFGAFSRKQGDAVNIFLLGRGVEAEQLDTAQFRVTEQIKGFVSAGGEILACGTCLKLRGNPSSDVCPLSTLQDLYNLIQQADRVLTF
jgi:sulfur relay (sulfurtransferase) complex TusBCD TusD component (DsrE family)